MLLNLAYPLSSSTPFYKHLKPPRVDQLFGLEHGHDCNSYYLTTSNHAGTHVDAPRHFDAAGRRIAEYALEELEFHRPALADFAVGAGELIGRSAIEGLVIDRSDCDILLLRTGSGDVRAVDPRAYVDRGPGFDRGGAEALLERLPSLRALAVDFMSISALSREKEGAEAHRVFLGCHGSSDRSILLAEDVRLPADLACPTHVRIVPWLVEELDSAPCSILAEVERPAA